MKTVNVKIEGKFPLLVNRFHEDAQHDATSGVHARKEALSPFEDATNRLYQQDGVPYWPGENLRQCLIAASSRTKIGRRSASSDMAAALYVDPFAIPIDGAWEVDARPVVIPATRGRIVRYRPIFKDWRLSFQLQVDTDLVDLGTVRHIMDDAGNYVGIGDFRPQKKGPHGRFQVVGWEVL